jgi:hypothetical protein
MQKLMPKDPEVVDVRQEKEKEEREKGKGSKKENAGSKKNDSSSAKDASAGGDAGGSDAGAEAAEVTEQAPARRPNPIPYVIIGDAADSPGRHPYAAGPARETRSTCLFDLPGSAAVGQVGVLHPWAALERHAGWPAAAPVVYTRRPRLKVCSRSPSCSSSSALAACSS